MAWKRLGTILCLLWLANKEKLACYYAAGINIFVFATCGAGPKTF